MSGGKAEPNSNIKGEKDRVAFEKQTEKATEEETRVFSSAWLTSD